MGELIGKKEKRGLTPSGVRESCGNCKHRTDGPVCLDDTSEDSWCSHYDYRGGSIVCADCRYRERCDSTTRAGGCQIRYEKKLEEERLEEMILDERDKN